jgi:hypothetical protein
VFSWNAQSNEHPLILVIQLRLGILQIGPPRGLFGPDDTKSGLGGTVLNEPLSYHVHPGLLLSKKCGMKHPFLYMKQI